MAPKRKRSKNDDGAAAHRDHKRFAYLKPRVRHIAERTIKSKWTTLPEPVQEKVREMFRSLERPVIVRHRDERKRVEAQAAVGAVVKK
jgi:kinetochore protein Fta7